MQLWYYYSTYLAARLAGFTHSPAQDLAYLCQTLDEMLPDTELTRAWKHGDSYYLPCLSGIDDGQPLVILDEARLNCELVFRRLPNLRVEPVPKVGGGIARFFGSFNSSSPLKSVKTRVQTLFNPLTDIDWLKRGRFRDKLQDRLAQETPELAEDVMDEPEEQTELSHQTAPPESITCTPNNPTAFALLKDGIDKLKSKKRSDGPVDEMTAEDLALLAVCIYTLQNCWLQPISGRFATQDSRLEEAFLAALYGLICFVNDTDPKWQKALIQHTELKKFFEVTEAFEPLLDINRQSRNSENPAPQQHRMTLFWLRTIPELLAQYDCPALTAQDLMDKGLGYRKGDLLQALYQSGAVNTTEPLKRNILDIAQFQNSLYFQINRAMQWQCQWLQRELDRANIENMPVIQEAGDSGL